MQPITAQFCREKYKLNFYYTWVPVTKDYDIQYLANYFHKNLNNNARTNIAMAVKYSISHYIKSKRSVDQWCKTYFPV